MKDTQEKPFFELGHNPALGKVHVDINTLIASRMLIQANSGGGKSWAVRLLAEGVAPYVQTIIIDPEGEFLTLREKLDLIAVASPSSGGEIAPHPAMAAQLARRLVELRVGAVLDLSDLKPNERREFVRRFVDSIMSVPRSLWHQMMILVDEAQLFCPERSEGEAESADSIRWCAWRRLMICTAI